MLDVVQAQLRALLAEIHRDAEARREPFAPKEFLLFQEADPEPETVNGVSAADWKLAMYLKAVQARQQAAETSAALSTFPSP